MLTGEPSFFDSVDREAPDGNMSARSLRTPGLSEARETSERRPLQFRASGVGCSCRECGTMECEVLTEQDNTKTHLWHEASLGAHKGSGRAAPALVAGRRFFSRGRDSVPTAPPRGLAVPSVEVWPALCLKEQCVAKFG